jgi:hypothetical protein
VYDAGNLRISVYALQNTTGEHVADQRIDTVVWDMCAVGRRRFLVTPEADRVIREIDQQGRVLRSFGVPEEADASTRRRMAANLAKLRLYYNQARIACDPISQTLALVHENVPIVRLFGVDGAQQWRTVLADFHQRELHHSAIGMGFGMRIDPRIGSAHSAAAVAFAPGGRLVVTLWEGSPSDLEGRIEARVLDITKGRELSRTLPPSRLARVFDGRSYGYAQHPYPKVLVYTESR